MKHTEDIKFIISCLGGANNIVSVVHCATRLRIVLRDFTKVDETKLNTIDLVKGTFQVKGQFQIIIGSGTVNIVCDEMNQMLGFKAQATEPQEKKKFGIYEAVKVLSDIFVPIIPAIVAGGLLMGLYNVLTSPLFANGENIITRYPTIEGLASMINSFANAPFIYLPVLIGFSATRIFGGNPFLGAAMGMIMVHPDLLNAYAYGNTAPENVPVWNIFGFAIQKVGYQGTVLPVLFISWILAKIEQKLRSITPSWLDNLTTPLLSILITSALTFTFVGPILREAGDLFAAGIINGYNFLGTLGGLVFGATYAPIVITGLHQSFVAVETTLIAAKDITGGTFIFVTAAMSNIAQGTAVLTTYFLTKDTKVKSLCIPTGVSALLGITEPAMFGVNLKLRYPFLGACIGAAMGAAWIAFTQTKAVALGAAGLLGFVSVLPSMWTNYFIGVVITIVVASVATVVAKKVSQKRELEKFTETAKEQYITEQVKDLNPTVAIAPIATGRITALSESSDDTFASGMVGSGVLFHPEDNVIKAPASAKVLSIFPTKHAFILELKNGAQIMLHIGINTVNLNGAPFKVLVKEGDSVAQGQPLVEVDFDAIRQAGLSTETPLILLNADEEDATEKFKIVLATDIQNQDQVIKITRYNY